MEGGRRFGRSKLQVAIVPTLKRRLRGSREGVESKSNANLKFSPDPLIPAGQGTVRKMVR